MEQSSDIYTLLVSYAERSNAVIVNKQDFLRLFLKQSGPLSHVAIWVKEREGKFNEALESLKESGKCETILDEAGNIGIFLPLLCQEYIRQRYNNLGEIRNLPFPSEESMGIKIPEHRVLFLGVESELAGYLDSIPEDASGIIKIGFPAAFGSALALAELIPRRLIEAALYKISNYLSVKGNLTYVYQKLMPQFKTKENYLRSMLEQIMEKPQKSYENLIEGNELSYIFWGFFTNLLIRDIKEKNSQMDEEVATIQAAYIIEAAVSSFKAKAAKQHEKEAAFRLIEKNINRPPYLYSLGSILQFTNSNGKLLMEICGGKELEDWLKKKSTESEEHKLPEILFFQGQGHNQEQYFLPKDKYILLCDKMVSDLKDKVKAAIIKRWDGILRDYQTEAAMDDDKEFDRLIHRYVERINPFLVRLLADPRLQIAYFEMGTANEVLTASSRLFFKGQVSPYSLLFGLNRYHMLHGVRSALPLRYTLPIISAIFAFFKHWRRKKGSASGADNGEKTSGRSENLREAAIHDLEAALVPEGYTLDAFLVELEGRWMQITDRGNRQSIQKDVNTLIKNKLRQSMDSHKRRMFTLQELGDMADSIVEWSPTLRKINGKESLKKYIEVYFVKLLKNAKV